MANQTMTCLSDVEFTALFKLAYFYSIGSPRRHTKALLTDAESIAIMDRVKAEAEKRNKDLRQLFEEYAT